MTHFDPNQHARDARGKFTAMSTSEFDSSASESTRYLRGGDEDDAWTITSKDGLRYAASEDGTTRIPYEAEASDAEIADDIECGYDETPVGRLAELGEARIYSEELAGPMTMRRLDESVVEVSFGSTAYVPRDMDENAAREMLSDAGIKVSDAPSTLSGTKGPRAFAVTLSARVPGSTKAGDAATVAASRPDNAATMQANYVGGIHRSVNERIADDYADSRASIDESGLRSDPDGDTAWAESRITLDEDSISREVVEDHPQLIEHYVRSRFGADVDRSWDDLHEDGMAITFSTPVGSKDAAGALEEDTAIREYDASLNGGGVESFDAGLARTYRDYGIEPMGDGGPELVAHPNVESETVRSDLAKAPGYYTSSDGADVHSRFRAMRNPTGTKIEVGGVVGDKDCYLVEGPDGVRIADVSQARTWRLDPYANRA